jgi:hypothetical protein
MSSRFEKKRGNMIAVECKTTSITRGSIALMKMSEIASNDWYKARGAQISKSWSLNVNVREGGKVA